MMSKTKKLYSISLSLICLATICTDKVNAQNANDSLSMDVTFVGEREMVVKDAIKLQSWPEPSRLDGGNRDFSYKLLSKRLNINPEWTQIDPVRLKVDAPLARLYRGYFRGGYGMYNTPLLDISLTDLRSREGTWGIKANHFATNVPNDSVNNRFSNSGAEVWASRFIGKEKIDASAFVNNNSVVYYGNPVNNDYSPNESLGIDESYLSFGSSISLKSHYRDSTKLNHKVDFNWIQLRTGSGLVDNNYGGKFEVGKFVGTEKFSFSGYYNFDKIIVGPLLGNNPINEGIAGIEPTVTTYKGKLTVKAGAGLWVDADLESRDPNNDDAHNFYFFPKVEASLSLMKDLFIPYLRLDGSLQQNRLQTVISENRFFDYIPIQDGESLNSPLRTTARKNDLSVGMRGTITKALSFNFYGRSVKFDDYMYFKNTAISGGSRFETFYSTLRINSIGGNVNLNIKENFDIGFDAELFNYNNFEVGQNWNLPKYKTSIDLSYSIIDKITIKSTSTLVSLRNAISEVEPDADSGVNYVEYEDAYSIELPSYLDINLNLEYRYNSRTGIWVSINNLTGAEYHNWAGYRVQGLQALLGASYSF